MSQKLVSAIRFPTSLADLKLSTQKPATTNGKFACYLMCSVFCPYFVFNMSMIFLLLTIVFPASRVLSKTKKILLFKRLLKFVVMVCCLSDTFYILHIGTIFFVHVQALHRFKKKHFLRLFLG